MSFIVFALHIVAIAGVFGLGYAFGKNADQEFVKKFFRRDDE